MSTALVGSRRFLAALLIVGLVGAVFLATPSMIGAFWAGVGVLTASAGPVAAGTVGAVGAIHSTIQSAAWGFVYGGVAGAIAGLITGL